MSAPDSRGPWPRFALRLQSASCSRKLSYSDDVRTLRLSGAVALTLAAAATVHTGLDVTGNSHLGVFWAKGEEQTGTLFERWNTYSRVRVTALARKPRSAGALPARRMQDRPELPRYRCGCRHRHHPVRRRYRQAAYLKDDVINAAYLVQPAADVAVVGVGGGRDILSGLFFGAKHIHGIEINPAIFEVLTEKFADFSGHLDRQPGVSLVNAEARSYINHSSERYDLVQISLIDTWAATAAGGLTLTENRLYTVEAWDDFYRALKPGGLLSVSRWYDPDKYRGEFYRLVAIAASALQRKGVPAAELPASCHRVERRQHRHGDHPSRRLHRCAMAGGARTRLSAQGFKIMLGPGVAFDAVTSTLMSGKADAAFFASLPENIAPSTDDNPFFFYHIAPRRSCRHRSWRSTNNNAAISMTVLAHRRRAAACGYYIVAALPPSREADAAVDADAAGGLFQRDRHGLHADRDIADAAADGLPRPSRLWAERRAVHDSSFQRDRQRHSRCGYPSAARDRRARVTALLTTLVAAGLLTPLVTTWARSEATDMRILVVGPAAGASGILHGDDVPARPQYLAPS